MVSSVVFEYEQLPGAIKDNLTAEQWEEALPLVLPDGAPAPESTIYINLKSGQQRQYAQGDSVHGPALAVHNLAGGRGQDSTQFHTAPEGAPPGT